MGLEISKEEIHSLPIETFEGEIIVVDKVENVKKAVDYLQQFHLLGFDTETKPVFRKNVVNKVALLQLSTVDRCYLFRLNKIKYPSYLDNIIYNDSITKVGLSLKDDFAALKGRTSNCTPSSFIDLQDFVKIHNIEEMSLQKIYGILFKKKISKNQRLSNWEARSLTPAQQMYAAIDAWACLRIYNYLINKKTS